MLTVRPTRIRPLLRIRMALRAAYLRWLIKWHEQSMKDRERGLEVAQWEIEHFPALQRHTQIHIDNLRTQLIDCELCTRPN